MPATKKAASTKSEPTKTKTAAKTATRTTAAPAAKQAAPAPAAREAAAAKPKAEAPRKGNGAPQIDPERRRNYVEVAAYYIAERRGFASGDQAMDWLAAEQEIDRLLQENKLSA
jgi:Protein of unknown function (DUF2934)